jgi:putative peptidoglycan lipid II flippase
VEWAPISANLRALPPPVVPPNGVSLARSTILVMAATLASAVLGFSREVVNARFYGTWWQMDCFLAAAVIPTILFGVFNGALVSVLVPVFSEYVASGREDEAWQLGSTVFNVLAIALTLLAVLGWICAPFYVPLIAHGFRADRIALTVDMTRWLMPSVVTTSLAGVVAAILNAHHRFSASAVQGIAINLVTVLTVLAFAPRLGIQALVLGTALGLTTQLIVQLPAVLTLRAYRFSLDLHHPGLSKILRMIGPIVVGSAAGQAAIFCDRYFASTLPSGYLSGMNYAVKLVGFPQQIFAAAIATVIFPLFASQFAASNLAGVRRSVVMGLRMVNFITIPSVFALIALGHPIIGVLFERGAFERSATDLCAGLLPYAAIGLVGTAASIVLTRCCFACKETRWTVAISVFAVLVNIVLSIWWIGPLGARGLLLANSMSQWVQAVFLFALVWRLVKGVDARALLVSAARILACSIAMLCTLDWIASLGVHVGAAFPNRAWYVFGQLVVAGFVFLGVAKLVGVEELSIAVRMILEKFETRVMSPPENREVPFA